MSRVAKAPSADGTITGPDEGRGMLVVAGDEGIDVIPELAEGCEAGVGERAALQDGEPDLDLVQPRGIGRVKWKWTLGWRASQRSRLGLWAERLSTMTWISLPGQAAAI